MARITIEDCIEHINNPFQLVLVAAKRARRIANGADPMLPWENDKPTVVALREIADGLVTEEFLKEKDVVVEPFDIDEAPDHIPSGLSDTP